MVKLLERRPASSNFNEFRSEAVCYFLKQMDLFSNLADHHLLDLAGTATVRNLEKGEYLFHKNEVAPGLYLVRRGIINFHRVAMDGREIVIHFYRPGEALSEIGVSDHFGCPADARAVVTSEIITISRRTFLAKMRECPELSLRFLSSIDRQLHQMADSIESIVSKNAGTRFVHWLLQQCKDQYSSQPAEIDLGMTKRALAGEIGVRQETLSRTLRLLANDGYLQVDGGHITINSPAALRVACRTTYSCAAAA